MRRSRPVQAVSVRSSPQRAQESTPSTLTCSRVRVLAQRASLYEGPLPLAPGRERRWRRWGSERGQAGVGGALRGVLFHEHRHQQLEQHQQGVDEGAALGGHLALGAQRLEPCLERVELCAQRRLVDRRHGPTAGLDRHHRPEHREALGRRSAA